MPRRQDGSKEAPGLGDGGRILTATRDGEGTGKVPNDLAPGTGGPTCTPGEALLSLPSRRPVRVFGKIGRRGSFVG